MTQNTRHTTSSAHPLKYDRHPQIRHPSLTSEPPPTPPHTHPSHLSPFFPFLVPRDPLSPSQAVCHTSSDYYSPHPDRFYYTPQPVCDRCIGLQSIDPNEDVLMLCDRKTELVALIKEQWRRLSGTLLSTTSPDSEAIPSTTTLLRTIVQSDTMLASCCLHP